MMRWTDRHDRFRVILNGEARICRATSIPLLVDGDHGYGNALNVARTKEELANVGVAAVTIEDTILPAPFGGAGSNVDGDHGYGNALNVARTKEELANVGVAALISFEEGVGKMRAAVTARPDELFVVIGRTNAGSTSLEDTIRRPRVCTHTVY
jgi:oxaloacetate decarboxylase